MNIPTKPKPSSFALEDIIISEVQDNLIDKVGWLTRAFGKCQRLDSNEDDKGHYPAFLMSEGEYVSLLPDEDLGNFAFFYCSDPQSVMREGRFYKVETPFSLIVWGNMNKLGDGATKTEAKDTILRALNACCGDGRCSVTNIYEKAENVYADFDCSEVKTQYLMHPYFGFRFEGVLTQYTTCV